MKVNRWQLTGVWFYPNNHNHARFTDIWYVSRGSRGSWHTSDHNAPFMFYRRELWLLSDLSEKLVLPLQAQTYTSGLLSERLFTPLHTHTHTRRKSAHRSQVFGVCGLDEDHRERRHEVCHLRSASSCSPTQRGNRARSHFCISLVMLKLFCLIDLSAGSLTLQTSVSAVRCRSSYTPYYRLLILSWSSRLLRFVTLLQANTCYGSCSQSSFFFF